MSKEKTSNDFESISNPSDQSMIDCSDPRYLEWLGIHTPPYEAPVTNFDEGKYFFIEMTFLNFLKIKFTYRS